MRWPDHLKVAGWKLEHRQPTLHQGLPAQALPFGVSCAAKNREVTRIRPRDILTSRPCA